MYENENHSKSKKIIKREKNNNNINYDQIMETETINTISSEKVFSI